MNTIEPGGTRGGLGLFFGGIALTAISFWFFMDSVRVNSYGNGLISRGFGGFGGTGNMGVIFLPLLVGIGALFYDASKRWAWVIFGGGLVLIIVEIVSKLNFFFDLKLSHFLLMLGGFSAGIGLILRSIRPVPAEPREPDHKLPERTTP
ncbi:MAG: hypothetical protein HKN26_07720 [Acidimicrobiales bacterium]|nr:hypothetical protein [Acidimicrobiales bacterium]